MSLAIETHSKTNQQCSTSELEWVACPGCGEAAPGSIPDSCGTFRVVQCTRCELCFTNPRPTSDTLERYYGEDYAPFKLKQNRCSAVGSGPFRAWLRYHYGYPLPPRGRLDWLMALLGGLYRNSHRRRYGIIPYRARGRLLDVGCGAGSYLMTMHALGWEVVGIDTSEIAVGQLRARGIEAHLGSLPHRRLQPDSFDAITLWNSLEHMPRPREVLAEVGRLLKPDGVLALGVPNYQSWAARHFATDWFGLDLPRHLCHFCPKSLREMLETSGFKTLSCQTVGRQAWIRQSIHNRHPGWPATSRWIAKILYCWGQLRGRGDYIRVVARPSDGLFESPPASSHCDGGEAVLVAVES